MEADNLILIDCPICLNEVIIEVGSSTAQCVNCDCIVAVDNEENCEQIMAQLVEDMTCGV